jgi:hypothetical protein
MSVTQFIEAIKNFYLTAGRNTLFQISGVASPRTSQESD